MLVRSRAPLRLSFAGGGTDVPPYPERRGGAVLNVTIDKYAYATLIPSRGGTTTVQSLDYDIVAKYHTDTDLRYDGELDLVKAALRHFYPGVKRGFRLFLHSDAPPGSGLGSSSTMVVALVGLFKHHLRRPMTGYDVADTAYRIERIDLKIAGGMQDQYAATFGGFNFIEFWKDRVVVNPLRVDWDVINELNYRLLLCYTGRTRVSANILRDQTRGFVSGTPAVVNALDELKSITIRMKDALLRGELDEFGRMLHEGWVNKKMLASRITSPYIDRLYAAARREGALGGKILGAGGGGYLLVYCPFEKKHAIARRLEALGGQAVDFSFEFRGLQTWGVKV